MDFKEATDRLAHCVTHEQIAEAAGVALQSIRQARLDPTSPSFRSPPPGWQHILAQLARTQSRALNKLADQLEREAVR
jgi:hypothetical protein